MTARREEPMRLEGRVALVTGAGGGIGAATARRFAREGATVVVNNVDLELARPLVTELQKEGARALSIAADVTARTDVEAMVNRVVGEFGRLDVLVNNAGVNRDAMSHKMTEEQWDQVLAVNLKGTFLCAQAVLAGMRERGWGRVRRRRARRQPTWPGLGATSRPRVSSRPGWARARGSWRGASASCRRGPP
jgi:3-oxoacyl-[acyl-carrier protein] reductase